MDRWGRPPSPKVATDYTCGPGDCFRVAVQFPTAVRRGCSFASSTPLVDSDSDRWLRSGRCFLCR